MRLFNLLFGILSLGCAPLTSGLSKDFCVGKPDQWNRNPYDCNKYFRCVHSKIYEGSCGAGLYWDTTINTCNFKHAVDCTTTEANTGTSTEEKTTKPTTETTTETVTEAVGTTVETTKANKLPPSSECDCSSRPGDCWCAGTRTPNELPAEQTPKMVMITFDDAVTDLNFDIYAELFDKRTNPNQCPVATTYFVSDEYTNYDRVRDLFARGHEIAVHTITHRSPSTFWASASYKQLVDEIVQMKQKLESEGIRDVVGYRNPFLQTAGDTTFQVLFDHGFLYDSTLTLRLGNYLWPYTLQNGAVQCVVFPCPTSSFPGLWEVPLLEYKDTTATCPMFDGCHRYSSQTKEGVFEFFKTNFDRHYATSSAPFPLFTHASWMMHHTFEYRKQGLIMFLDYLETRDDVYIVNINKVIEWMRRPTTLADIQNHSGPLSCSKQ